MSVVYDVQAHMKCLTTKNGFIRTVEGVEVVKASNGTLLRICGPLEQSMIFVSCPSLLHPSHFVSKHDPGPESQGSTEPVLDAAP